jgi:carbon monoxide dehydrogenase subunit G
MPGASVTSVEGDEIAGQVKVKLGPLSLSYKGTAKFTDKDAENRSISIEASGKETRGAGTASATVHAALEPGEAEGSTLVSIHTSLNVTGRPAQFGRSLLPEVSGKLIGQFATNLEALIEQDGAPAADAGADADTGAGADAGAASAEDTATGTAVTGTATTGTAVTGTAVTQGTGNAAATAVPVTTTPPKLPQQEESLNLIKLVGVPLLKRVLPIAAAAALVAVLGKRLSRVIGKGKSKS